jgi:hypothetical protein
MVATANDTRNYVDYLRDRGLKAVTCNKVLSWIKAMLRFGEQRRYLAEGASPARRVKLLKSRGPGQGRGSIRGEKLRCKCGTLV